MMSKLSLVLFTCVLTWSQLTSGQSYWSPYDHYPGIQSPYPSVANGHRVASPPTSTSARVSGPNSPFYPLFASPETLSPVVQDFSSSLVHDSLNSFGGPGVPGGHAKGCVLAAPPKIDWGDCPSLEAKEEDKKAKEEKQKDCMKNLELNENTTYAELTPVLQNRVRECTLRKDELINEAGKFSYDKAMEKIKAKGLPENVDKKVDEAHIECKIEAEQKFRSSATPLAEVDSYNECMDFHLAMLCKIKVVKNTQKVTNANSFHGVVPMPYAAPANVHSYNNFGDVMNKIQILSQALKR